ncbi:MAG: starch phosphorylase [Myxococcota bacterium]|jgi:starch phosphorylase
MLPAQLLALQRLAKNLWWSWDSAATELFESIDPYRWARCNRNPCAMLQDVEPYRWKELAADSTFLAKLENVDERFAAYMTDRTWCDDAAPHVHAKNVAYFSMEFGLHESVRIYSGGLGVLAGDHVRSASDLGVPLIGIGLMYREGYFRQFIDQGEQVDVYPRSQWDRLPIELCVDADGKEVVAEFPHGDGTYTAKVWRLAVGRTYLLLLDADHDGNPAHIRELTYRLYGGGLDQRIGQEVLLGIGGVSALRAMKLDPGVYHLNEGHCAFVPLALMKEARENGLSHQDAHQQVRQRCVFTTHTPVPAGHDRFGWDRVNGVLGKWRNDQSLPEGAFMDLGRVHPGDLDEPLTMTVLALRTSAKANGVSALHGVVSREMWHDMYPGRKVEDVPIGHITNGVHPVFFAPTPSRELFDANCPDWRTRPWDADAWTGLNNVSDADIRAWRTTLRSRLVAEINRRTHKGFRDDVLTIGFARRFAPYKRGALLFSQPERLLALMEKVPFQVVFAGKAHPRDVPGKAIVREVLKWSDDRRFRDRVAFIEDYDLFTGRMLTSGADVWLNNPRRPKEASGTSGQKAALNGGLNLSVLDGWWPEGFDGKNGFEIGEVRTYDSLAEHDAADAESLYDQLENHVLPLWMEGGKTNSDAWAQAARHAVQTCGPLFNSHRMVRDYVLGAYEPLAAEQ